MCFGIIVLMVIVGIMAASIVIFNAELNEEYDEYNEENKEDFD